MFKEVFVEHLERLLPAHNAQVLELGSGRSEAVAELLRRRPDISYTGVEPAKKDFEYAKSHIGSLPNVKLINDFAYDLGEGSYDLCFSLSVLEHVKQLEKFLQESVRVTRPGGHIVHRYDLGHALHPASSKERFQVLLGNHIPKALSEHKFVRYLDPDEVVRLLKASGAEVERITRHQMPGHKSLLKQLPNTPENVALEREIIEWEFKVSPALQDIPKRSRERLFPAIALWARKAEK